MNTPSTILRGLLVSATAVSVALVGGANVVGPGATRSAVAVVNTSPNVSKPELSTLIALAPATASPALAVSTPASTGRSVAAPAPPVPAVAGRTTITRPINRAAAPLKALHPVKGATPPAAVTPVTAKPASAAVTPTIHYFYTPAALAAQKAMAKTGRYTAPAGSAGPLILSTVPVNGAPRVVHNPKVWMVYWGWDGTTNGVRTYLGNLLTGLGGSTWLGSQTQYYDSAGNITNPTGQYQGAYVDPNAMPANPTKAQLNAEALLVQSAISGTTFDPDTQFVLATPPGTTPEGFGSQYCGYHSFATIAGTAKYVPFTTLPYQPDQAAGCAGGVLGGGLDGYAITEGHEYAETITDRLPTYGWVDKTGGQGETGDKCASIYGGESGIRSMAFSTGTFPMQSLWSNRENACVQRAPNYWTTSTSIPSDATTGRAPYIFGESCPANSSGEVLYCYAAGDQQDASGNATHGVVYRATVNPATGDVPAGGWGTTPVWQSALTTTGDSLNGISCVDSGAGTTGTAASHTVSCFAAMSHVSVASATCAVVPCTQVLVCSASGDNCGATGDWLQTPLSAGNGKDLYAISCPDVNDCAAVGSNGTTLWATASPNLATNWHGTPSGYAPPFTTSDTLLALSCPMSGSNMQCAAGALNGRARIFVPNTNPAIGVGTFAVASTVPGAVSVNGIACPTAQKCWAATDTGIVQTTDAAQTWTAQGPAGLTLSVACAPLVSQVVADCSSVGTGGGVVTAGVDAAGSVFPSTWNRDTDPALGAGEYDAIGCSATRGVHFCHALTQGGVVYR